MPSDRTPAPPTDEPESFFSDGERMDAGFPNTKYFRWSSQGGVYVLCDKKRGVDLVKATESNARAFFTGKYKEIWDDFDPSLDSVGEYYLDNGFIARYRRLEKASTIRPGTYKFDQTPTLGYILDPVKYETDAYIPLKIGVKGLTEDVQTFFANEKVYTDLDMRYRRAALVYGPPGNGKTFCIMRIAKELVDKVNCVVLQIDGSGRTLHWAHQASTALEGHNILLIMEEITTHVRDESSDLLEFLDGETSWTRCYTIATTNYPEKLPTNIVDRPGRFDFLYQVDNPGKEDRRAYLSRFIDDVPESLIISTENFSISYLREVILRSRLNGVAPEVVVKDLKNMKGRISGKFADAPGGRYV